jgi:hypothetical protein
MNAIIIRRDAVTRRWCVIDRTQGHLVLATFSSRSEAVAALATFRGAQMNAPLHLSTSSGPS